MTQGVEMLPVDWSLPVEAVHDDGRVCAAVWTGVETIWRSDGHTWHSVSRDGTTGFDGWRIRNVASHTHPAATGSVRVVPVEPTQAMREAGEIASWDDANHMPAINLVRSVWSAMLAAAPTPDAAETAPKPGQPGFIRHYALEVKGTRMPSTRGKCPACGKKGLSIWRDIGRNRVRECRYCGHGVYAS